MKKILVVIIILSVLFGGSIYVLDQLGLSAVREIGTAKAEVVPNVDIFSQIHGLYEVSGTGDVQYITEDVYGERVMELNGVTEPNDLLTKGTIVVPWMSSK